MIEDLEKRSKAMVDKLAPMKWTELKELGVNMQVVGKIKRGESVTLRNATIKRLEKALK